MDSSKKITTGILGGSFDPVHLGHLKLAQSAIESGKIDEIFFIPASQAPLRDAPVRVSSAQRLEMLKIALEKFPYPFSIEECEIQRGEISYAIDTAKFLSAKYQNRKFKWIVGADHIEKLNKWKDIDDLSKIVSFICAKRIEFNEDISALPPCVNLEFFDFTPIPHSSTKIRENLADGKRNLFMLDPNVEKFILENKLYNT